MLLKLTIAVLIVAIVIAIENQRRPRWTRDAKWDVRDVLLRFGLFVPWLLGIFALLSWFVGAFVR